ncbi:MAG: hypothetical protein ACTSO3_01335 [Candidatus Heimdallarchaeaceae archaeon]
MVDINTVLRIEKEVKKLGQEKDRAKGRVEQQMETLKEKFKCSSFKQGQQSLKKTEVKLKKIDNEYESSLNSFMEKWGDKLGEEE